MSAIAQAEARLSGAAGQVAGWARTGAQSFLAAQSILLDLTAQQTALVIGVVRERAINPNIHPIDALAGMADSGVSSAAAAGKILLDLIACESAVVMNGVKEGLRLPPLAGAVADVASQRIDTILQMQKCVLEAAAGQTHAAVESYKEGNGLNVGANAIEFARRSVEGVIESEKKYLDFVAEEASAVADGGKEGRKPARPRAKVLIQMAREGADEFIEAQKKLLDLAIGQIEAASKAIGTETSEEEEPRTSWATLTEKSVHNFVSAQKSLLDLAAKPLRPAAEARQKTARPAARKKVAKRTKAKSA